MVVVERPPSPSAGRSPSDADALFKEAKRRERRRRFLLLGGVLLVACLAIAVVAAIGGLSGPGGGLRSRAIKPSRPLTLAKATIQNVPLPRNLTNALVVAGDGSLVVVGSVGEAGRCEMVRLNPSTLKEATFTLPDFTVPACGVWASWSGGSVLLVVDQYIKDSNDEQLRLERIDPSNGEATIGPGVMPLVGSQIAHVGFAYGDSSLWIAGNTPRGSLLVRVSPTSGTLLEQWVLPFGFDTAVLTADSNGAWISSTPVAASNLGLYHVVAGSPVVTKVNDLPGSIGTVWLQAEGNDVVALTGSLQGSGAAQSSQALLTLLGQGGTTTLFSPVRSGAGFTPAVASNGDLLSLDPQYPNCTTAHLDKTDPKTGETERITRFRSEVSICDASGGRCDLVASAGKWIFVLKNWYGDKLVRVGP